MNGPIVMGNLVSRTGLDARNAVHLVFEHRDGENTYDTWGRWGGGGGGEREREARVQAELPRP